MHRDMALCVLLVVGVCVAPACCEGLGRTIEFDMHYSPGVWDGTLGSFVEWEFDMDVNGEYYDSCDLTWFDLCTSPSNWVRQNNGSDYWWHQRADLHILGNGFYGYFPNGPMGQTAGSKIMLDGSADVFIYATDSDYDRVKEDADFYAHGDVTYLRLWDDPNSRFCKYMNGWFSSDRIGLQLDPDEFELTNGAPDLASSGGIWGPIGTISGQTPEPASAFLLLLGAPVAIWARRRRKTNA